MTSSHHPAHHFSSHHPEPTAPVPQPPPQHQPTSHAVRPTYPSTASASSPNSSGHTLANLRGVRPTQAVHGANRQNDARPVAIHHDEDEEILRGGTSWAQHFCRQPGNEFFCLIPLDYMTDRFNLTNLNEAMDHFQPAWRVITSNRPAMYYATSSTNNLMSGYTTGASVAARIGARHALPVEMLELAAAQLYGLIHARYVLSTDGVLDVLRKYRRKDYGWCPRVYCEQAALLPVGMTDRVNVNTVKMYCASCNDVYEPRKTRHRLIDGAYFGTGLPHMLYMTHPTLRPPRSEKSYHGTLYGFRLAPADMVPADKTTSIVSCPLVKK